MNGLEVNQTYPALAGARKITPVVMDIFQDEPCMSLREVNLNCKGYRGFHRYQVLNVVRGDSLAEAWIDMGAVKKYQGIEQFNIIGGGYTDDGIPWFEETVESLRFYADQLRGKKLFDKNELLQMDNVTDRS